MGKLMITVMLAFAEYERDIIVERTQTGKAVARANGKRVGGWTTEEIQAGTNRACTGDAGGRQKLHGS